MGIPEGSRHFAAMRGEYQLSEKIISRAVSQRTRPKMRLPEKNPQRLLVEDFDDATLLH